MADLSHAQKALYEQQAQDRQLTQQLTTLQDAAQQAKVLATQIAGMEAQVQELRDQVATTLQKDRASSARVRELEQGVDRDAPAAGHAQRLQWLGKARTHAGAATRRV